MLLQIINEEGKWLTKKCIILESLLIVCRKKLFKVRVTKGSSYGHHCTPLTYRFPNKYNLQVQLTAKIMCIKRTQKEVYMAQKEC